MNIRNKNMYNIQKMKKIISPYSKFHPLEKLQNPALIVIDMQRYFISPDGDAHISGVEKIVPNIIKLINNFDSKALAIIFTRHCHKRNSPKGSMHRFWDGDLLYEDDPQAEITVIGDRLSVINDKKITVINKEYYSAFEGTDLEKILRSHNVQDIVLTGVMTHLCVETTARVGFIKGFRPIVIMDATATKNEEMHLASLRAMAHGFAHVVTTKALSDKL